MSNEFNNLLEEDLAGRSLAVGQVVNGTVVQISEDGVFVDIGAKSEGHLELDQIFQEELASLQIGSEVKVRIVKKVEGEFKLSKKSVDFEEAWTKLIANRDSNTEVDVLVKEKVKNGYMAVAFDVLEGFIHHTNFKGRPALGQNYKVKVLDLNRKARKLVFTRREILKREEEEALERDYSLLQEGMVIEGEVEKLSPYGAFVKITEHLTGLLHISEFSFEHVKKPSEVLKSGERVQVKILGIDREKNKISLSRKATLTDPLLTLLPGEELDGKVESLAEFGVFVRLDCGVTGLVHVSELSFKRFNHPSELVKPSETIRVKVLRVQPDDRRVSLSAKACERDPWEDIYSRFMVDQRVRGMITQVLQSGAVVKLDEFFEAFIPISEISEERINHPGDVLNEADEIEGVIISIDAGKRRIRVSLRRSAEDVEVKRKGEVPTSHSATPMDATPTAGKVTLGDILGSKLDLSAVTQRDKEESKSAKAAIANAATEDAEAKESAAEEAVAEESQPVDQEAEEAAAVEVTAEGSEEAEEVAAVEVAADSGEEAEEAAAVEVAAEELEPEEVAAGGGEEAEEADGEEAIADSAAAEESAKEDE
jgi:small subunit ribosomal protein S1